METDERILEAEAEYFEKRILTIKSEKYACAECDKVGGFVRIFYSCLKGGGMLMPSSG